MKDDLELWRTTIIIWNAHVSNNIQTKGTFLTLPTDGCTWLRSRSSRLRTPGKTVHGTYRI